MEDGRKVVNEKALGNVHGRSCNSLFSVFISFHFTLLELTETVTHPDPGIYKSSDNDLVSQLRNGRKVLFGEVSLWTSVCCNIKQQICSLVDLINAFNIRKVLRCLTQWSVAC